MVEICCPEAGLYLYFLRFSGWAWELSWHEIESLEKSIQIFTRTWEPPVENEDPKKWRGLSVYNLGWTKRSNCGKATKTYRDSKGRSKEDNQVFFVQVSLDSWSLVIKMFLSSCIGRASFTFDFQLLLSGRKGRSKCLSCTCCFSSLFPSK